MEILAEQLVLIHLHRIEFKFFCFTQNLAPQKINWHLPCVEFIYDIFVLIDSKSNDICLHMYVYGLIKDLEIFRNKLYILFSVKHSY